MLSTFGSLGALLLQYKYFILLPVAMIDGPIVIMIAGLLVSLGYMSLVPVFILSVCGDVSGDFIRYGLGRWGGQAFILRWGKYLGFDERHIVGIEEAFKERTGFLLLVAKFAYGAGSVFHAAAGIAKISISKFFIHNFLSSIPKTAALLYIGYYFGNAINDVDSALGNVALTLLFVIIISIFIWAYRYGKKNKKNGIKIQ